MTTVVWIGIASILTTLIITVGGFVIRHAIQDAQDKGELRAELAHIKEQIGSRNSGMRGDIHEHSGALTWFGGCLWFIANKIGVELPKRDKS